MTKLFHQCKELVFSFRVPLFVLLGIISALVFTQINLPLVATSILFVVIAVGSFDLVRDTVSALFQRRFALDYIALLAITVGLVTGQYLVAAVIVLMLSGGNTLEEYGMSQAKQSLTALVDRIPNQVLLWKDGQLGKSVHIDSIVVGQQIAVRKGEVIPLDGTLVSEQAQIDESSLTGEPYFDEKITGDRVRSGTVNEGDVLVLEVSTVGKDSTYRKIVEMVQQAQLEKAPLIRLADRYSALFTLMTLVLAGLAYAISGGDMIRVLSVLVIATPCPLILATPIALMGGMNAAAKKRIILKRLASLEVLSRVDTIVFDKTGTLTFGKPELTKIDVLNKKFSIKEVLAIAGAIERHSLHPLAKAIVERSLKEKTVITTATEVREEIGTGISGTVHNQRYTLSKLSGTEGMAIQLLANKKQIAIFTFEDKLKESAKQILSALREHNLRLELFTGDKKKAAEDIVEKLGEKISINAEMSPEDKKDGIISLKNQHHVIAMVGDGINDAPALALADVGMVFSNHEQTAASEAADVVFLNGNISAVTDSISISQRTIHIALQSIVFGIGLSVIGMSFAAFGFIPAVAGAFIQEGIDIAVILNAVRASRSS